MIKFTDTVLIELNLIQTVLTEISLYLQFINPGIGDLWKKIQQTSS